MEASWIEGDPASAVCPCCQDLMVARTIRISSPLPRTRFLVGNLVVQICAVCDTLLGAPRVLRTGE